MKHTKWVLGIIIIAGIIALVVFGVIQYRNSESQQAVPQTMQEKPKDVSLY